MIWELSRGESFVVGAQDSGLGGELALGCGLRGFRAVATLRRVERNWQCLRRFKSNEKVGFGGRCRR
jgi:hypothetical protein